MTRALQATTPARLFPFAGLDIARRSAYAPGLGGQMRALALGLIAALAVLHHDFWFWDDPTLVAGVMPVGLAWHVGVSVAGSGVWWFVTRAAWPGDPAAHRGERAP